MFLADATRLVDATRPVAVEGASVKDKTLNPCPMGFGKCCTTKCNGLQGFGQRNLTYSNCNVKKGEVKSIDTPKLFGHSRFYTDIPLHYGDYVCEEVCLISNLNRHPVNMTVYRAGGDPNKPAICKLNWRES
eukprot:Skav211902  [mRNA]  locus=scaffold4123:49990:50385:+ [translate_table: standard]